MGKKSRILFQCIAILGFLLLYVPLAVLVVESFLGRPAPGEPMAWTLDWYRKVLSNEAILGSVGISLWVAALTTLVSTVLGTAAAIAIDRYRFPGRKVLDVMVHVPLIMPEIVMGISMLSWFVFLNLTLGVVSIVLAHVTFSVSYVILTVKARLESFDHSLEEAARDLGASPWQTFRRVTFPLIWPGIFSGALMAFTVSFDDFLLTFFTAGVGSDTLPLKIYAMIKFGVSREINAVSTLLLAITLLFALAIPFAANQPRSPIDINA